MIEIEARPPHAIIYVSDPNNKMEDIPKYQQGKLVAATDTCISIGTIAPMDGAVAIRLVNNGCPTEGIRVFDGRIKTPSHELAVSTSELEVLARVSVVSDKIHLCICVDDEREPTQITVCWK